MRSATIAEDAVMGEQNNERVREGRRVRCYLAYEKYHTLGHVIPSRALSPHHDTKLVMITYMRDNVHRQDS
jgi:hypothetical protein